MDQVESILKIPLDCETTVALVTHLLSEQKLRVKRSFDLQSACASFTDNICPHHGKAPCDCQLVVLLVYNGGHRPISLLLHGHSGKTQLGISENDYGLPASPGLETRVRSTLAPKKVNALLKELSLSHG